MTGMVDVIVWVTDPQKYADAVLHQEFVQPFAGHDAVDPAGAQPDRSDPGGRARGGARVPGVHRAGRRTRPGAGLRDLRDHRRRGRGAALAPHLPRPHPGGGRRSPARRCARRGGAAAAGRGPVRAPRRSGGRRDRRPGRGPRGGRPGGTCRPGRGRLLPPPGRRSGGLASAALAADGAPRPAADVWASVRSETGRRWSAPPCRSRTPPPGLAPPAGSGTSPTPPRRAVGMPGGPRCATPHGPGRTISPTPSTRRSPAPICGPGAPPGGGRCSTCSSGWRCSSGWWGWGGWL